DQRIDCEGTKGRRYEGTKGRRYEGTKDLMPRPDGRANDQLRPLTLERGASPYAEGSCLVRCGGTLVLCTASVEKGVPGCREGSVPAPGGRGERRHRRRRSAARSQLRRRQGGRGGRERGGRRSRRVRRSAGHRRGGDVRPRRAGPAPRPRVGRHQGAVRGAEG